MDTDRPQPRAFWIISLGLCLPCPSVQTPKEDNYRLLAEYNSLPSSLPLSLPLTPLIRAMPESKHSFFWELFPKP